MNKREFVQRFFIAGVVLTVPFKWAYGKIQHRLYGDGKADDTVALQALLDGEPVIMPNGQTIQHNGDLTQIPNGTYRTTQTLNLGPPRQGTINMNGSHIKYEGCVLNATTDKNCHIGGKS